MPIYEYQCQSCGHIHEAIQKISDAPLTDCPACNQPKLTKKISAAGFRLKGGGWYETDFKGRSKKKVDGEASTTAKKESNSTSSSESKSTGSGSGASQNTGN